MPFDSLVRTKQLNQPELSGYIVDVFLKYLKSGTVTGIATNTGQLTGQFYPLRTNPSGYLTTGNLTGYASTSYVTSSDSSILAYVDNTFYPLSNPSGFITSGDWSGLGTSTGDFNIVGVAGITVTGIDNVIYISGNGEASLTGYVPWTYFTEADALSFDYFRLLSDGASPGGLWFGQTDYILGGYWTANPSTNVVIDMWGSQHGLMGLTSDRPYIMGFDVYAGNLQSSGYNVLTVKDATGFATYNQLVITSGLLTDETDRLRTEMEAIVGAECHLYNTGVLGGVSTQFVTFPATGISGLGPNPTVLASLSSATNQTIVPFMITGAVSSGFWISYATSLPDNSYRLSVMAAPTSLTGLITHLTNNTYYQTFPSAGVTSLSVTGYEATGNVIVSGFGGTKVFTSGGLILVSGGGGSSNVDSRYVVMTTGDQTISGYKIFDNTYFKLANSLNNTITLDMVATAMGGAVGQIYVSPIGMIFSSSYNSQVFQNIALDNIVDGPGPGSTILLKPLSRTLSGNWVAGSMSVSGYPVMVSSGQTFGGGINVVYTTGEQIISGTKHFQDTGFFKALFAGRTGIPYLPPMQMWEAALNADGAITNPYNNLVLSGYSAIGVKGYGPMGVVIQGGHNDTLLGGDGSNVTISAGTSATDNGGSIVFNAGAGYDSAGYGKIILDSNSLVKVGIATNAPSYTCDVNGDLNSRSTLRMRGRPVITGATGIGGAIVTFSGTSMLVISGGGYVDTGSLAPENIGLPTDGTYGGVNGPIAGIAAGDRHEDAFDKIEVILGKLAPSKPLYLSQATFSLTGSTYTAYMQGTSTSYTIQATQRPTGYVTGFYDGDNGILSGFVNGVATGSQTLTTGVDTGRFSGLTVYADWDFWTGVQGKAGFWSSLSASVGPSGINYVPSGRFTLQLQHSTAGSTAILTGYSDVPSTSLSFSNTFASTGAVSLRWVDGVPCLANGDKINAGFTGANAVTAFYANPIGQLTTTSTICNAVNLNTPAGNPTPVSGQSLALSGALTVNNGVFSSGVQVNYALYNSIGTSSSASLSTSFRVDTTSSLQSQRRTAGSGQFPAAGYGSGYDVANTFAGNEELQMVNNVIGYPQKVNYGSYTPAGPNYTNIPSGSNSGYRWAFFNFGTMTAQNIQIHINGSSNFGASQVVAGIQLYAKVSGQIGWIDCNQVYPNVGDPSVDGAPALVLSSGTATDKLVTFGTPVRTGPVYIRLGLPSGSNKTFGTITCGPA